MPKLLFWSWVPSFSDSGIHFKPLKLWKKKYREDLNRHISQKINEYRLVLPEGTPSFNTMCKLHLPLWRLTHRRRLLSFGCKYNAINSMSDLFRCWTICKLYYFTLKSFSFSLKSHMNVFDLNFPHVITVSTPLFNKNNACIC